MAEITIREINAAIKKWRKVLDIEKRWEITATLAMNADSMPQNNEDAIACITANSGYFFAEIFFNAVLLNKDDLDSVVCHELLHILIDPISSATECGLGDQYASMALTIIESTVERLLTGYMNLHRMIPKNKKAKKMKNKTPT